MLAAESAYAQDSAPSAAASAQPAPAARIAPPEGKTVTVVVAADSAPQQGVIECTLGEHSGVENADAETVRDLFAHELANRHAGAGLYEVRLGKLGGRLLLVLEEKHADHTVDERRTLIGGIEEVPVAAPRLIDALISGKPLEETQTANNVLSGESRSVQMKQGRMGFAGAVIGTTPISVSSGFAAGAELGIVYEADRFALTGHGRLASGSSGGDSQFTYFNLGIGARYFLTENDITPYVGAGAGFSVYNMSNNGDGSSFNGNGMNLYGEFGVEGFRAHHAVMFASVRLDAPLFALSESDYNGSTTKYAMPVSFNLGLIFK